MYLASNGLEAAVSALNPQNIARLEYEARCERAQLVSSAARALLARLRHILARPAEQPA